jgi:hypothetical protein
VLLASTIAAPMDPDFAADRPRASRVRSQSVVNGPFEPVDEEEKNGGEFILVDRPPSSTSLTSPLGLAISDEEVANDFDAIDRGSRADAKLI